MNIFGRCFNKSEMIFLKSELDFFLSLVVVWWNKHCSLYLIHKKNCPKLCHTLSMFKENKDTVFKVMTPFQIWITVSLNVNNIHPYFFYIVLYNLSLSRSRTLFPIIFLNPCMLQLTLSLLANTYCHDYQ